MKKEFKFLWITDPWETLDHMLDTTLRLIEESVQLGYDNYWCDVRTIQLSEKKIILKANLVNSVAKERRKESFIFEQPIFASPKDFDCIQYRVDAPLDANYIQPLQLLVLGLDYRAHPVTNRQVELVNVPTSILMSDKTEALLFDSLMPDTVVSSQWEILQDFGSRQGMVVLKPMHCCQSIGVRIIDWYKNTHDTNEAYNIVSKATNDFTTPVVLQQFLRHITEGEIRLWYLDGNLIGWAKKIPTYDPFIIHIDHGDPVVPVMLNDNELSTAKVIGKSLSIRKIRLAAVDIVDNKITDYNYISPGLLVQIENVMGKTLATSIIQQFVDFPKPYFRN